MLHRRNWLLATLAAAAWRGTAAAPSPALIAQARAAAGAEPL
jgi:hypothetical protein